MSQVDDPEGVRADARTLEALSARGLPLEGFLEAHVEDRLPVWMAAARAGLAEGCILVGRCCLGGFGCPQDAERAVWWFRQAAEQDHPLGLFNLARCYDQGDGVEESPAEAVALYQRAADQGLSLAWVNLANHLQEGRGVARDALKSLDLMELAADQGNLVAACNLGLTLETGDGVDPDPAAAVRWYRRAAEAGFGPGCFCLGLCYQDGVGVEADAEEAASWFLRGAEVDHPGAQFLLAQALMEGDGVEADPAAAVAWLHRSAAQGRADAALRLGLALITGQGIPQAPEEGVRWLAEAADAGEIAAFYALGVAHLRGDGVEADEDRARLWFGRAAMAGHEEAKRAIEALNEHAEAVEAEPPEAHARAVLAALSDPASEPEAWRVAAGQMLASAQDAEVPALVSAFDPLLQATGLADPERASFAALLVGALVEQGAPEEPVAWPMARLFIQVLDQVVPMIEGCEAVPFSESESTLEAESQEELEARLATWQASVLEMVGVDHPEVVDVWSALDTFCRPVIAVLSGHAGARRRLAAWPGILERLAAGAAFHDSLEHVFTLLTVPDGDLLRVIQAETGQGVDLRITGIADNFQLHVLLADTLVEAGLPGTAPSPTAVATARGRGEQQTGEVLQGQWGFYAWTALVTEHGSSLDPLEVLAHRLPEVDTDHRVWFEGRPADIPPFEGTPTLILGPADILRTWNNLRFFDRLQARCEVERVMSPDEVVELLERMRAAVATHH